MTSTEKKKEKVITVRLSEEQHQLAKLFSKVTGKSLNQFCVGAILNEIDKWQKELKAPAPFPPADERNSKAPNPGGY